VFHKEVSVIIFYETEVMKEHNIACARMPSNSQVHVAYIANLLMLPRDAIVRVLIKY